MAKDLTGDIFFTRELAAFRDRLHRLHSGNGTIFCVTGESGMGKTYLLNAIDGLCASNNVNLMHAYVKTQAPIGKFDVSNIQPLAPFTKAYENLLSADEAKVKKQFALKAGLTVLSGIPIAGDFFYMIKELGRDWREYRRDKSSANTNKVSAGAADYYDTLCSFADKAPLALLIDDMQWSDAQSIELLNLIAENLLKIPVIIVIAYRKTDLERKGSPLQSFVTHHLGKNPDVMEIDLQPFGRNQLTEMCRFLLPRYKSDKRFEDWIFDRSYGIPGVIAEYLNFFRQKSPFRDDGTLDDNFDNIDFYPVSVQAAFTEILSKFSDEEKNILSICSAEGRRFSAIIVSDLMNTDVLTTIKKLRSIQNRTGIIKSIGAQYRYGVKSTVYEFTQSFYHSFFETSLEYEEHVALHGQIAALLKQKYDEAESENIRQEIAPFLAAHSSESGDEETAKSMLLVAAKTAQEYGSKEMVESAYQSFRLIEEKGLTPVNTEEKEASPESEIFKSIMQRAEYDYSSGNGNSSNGNSDYPGGGNGEVFEKDFVAIRKAIVDAYHQGKYQLAADTASDYLKQNENHLRSYEKSILISIAVKSYIELTDLSMAEQFSSKGEELIKNENDPVSECFILNSQAILLTVLGKQAKADDILRRAAQTALNMPAELRLLTMANIASAYKESDPKKAAKYYSAIRTLGRSLHYDDFLRDLGIQ